MDSEDVLESMEHTALFSHIILFPVLSHSLNKPGLHYTFSVTTDHCWSTFESCFFFLEIPAHLFLQTLLLHGWGKRKKKKMKENVPEILQPKENRKYCDQKHPHCSPKKFNPMQWGAIYNFHKMVMAGSSGGRGEKAKLDRIRLN